jgi:hypothetical protein
MPREFSNTTITKHQADKFARTLVERVRKLVPPEREGQWSKVDVPLSDTERDMVDENHHLITGCLPVGWRISGEIGSSTLTILRKV